jgi:hypothetical protein
MRIRKYIFSVLLGILIFANSANAGLRPSFYLDWTTWQATDIAVVDNRKIIDGKLIIIESLQGSLKKGEVIAAPKLSKFSDKSWRTTGRSLNQVIVKSFPTKKAKSIIVTGRRMLIFLQRPSKNVTHYTLENSDHITIEGRTGLWLPTTQGSTEASTVWLDKGKAYSFVQHANPGPSILSKLKLDEKKIFARIRELVAVQEALKRIDRMENKAIAAKQASAYIDNNFDCIRKDAFTVLANCGRPALPTLLQVLADPNKTAVHNKAVDAIALIDDGEVDEKLTELFKRDIALWQKLGPTLKRGWWNGAGLSPKMNRRRLRNQYSRTLAYVYALEKRHITQARKSLDKFRRFWRSLPHLNDPSGLNQMSEACDLAIKAIDKNTNWWTKNFNMLTNGLL